MNSPNKPVTREEFARAWTGVAETAKFVDRLIRRVNEQTERMRQLDEQVARLSKAVDDLNAHVNPDRVNA